MTDVEPSPAVLSALDALSVGAVDRAKALLAEATQAGDDPVALELYAGVLLFDDELDAAREQLETAFRAWKARGAARSAALVAATLADVHTSWFGNRIAGRAWVARARRLLETEGPCVERGYVELAVLACDTDDIGQLEEAAATALELAREFGDTELEVRALADSGYALVVQGRLDEGFARLDEAMAALSAGEVQNPAVAGMSFCALLAACDRTGDVARAEEWTRVVARVMTGPLGDRPRALHTHCRLVYGSVLCTSGRWDEGEAELLAVLGPDASDIIVHRAEAAARLASVRLLQGRVDEAGELLRPYADRAGTCETLARYHVAKREMALAEAVARRGLDARRGDCLRAGALYGVLVEVALARDDVVAATSSASALEELATGTDCRLIRADALLARGRVHAATLDTDAAITALRAAQAELRADERPLFAGLVALELAQALHDAGDTGGAADQARAALGLFERLGATPLADRAAGLLRSVGARVRPTSRSAASAVADLTAREQQVLALVREGLTNAEIGGRLYISAKTAEHHVGRVLAKLGVRSRAEAAAVAAAAAPTPG